MSKTYDTIKIANAILSSVNLEKLSNFASKALLRPVDVKTSPRGDCYSNCQWRSNEIEIVLGLAFYQEAFKDPNPVEDINLKPFYKKLSKIMLGVFYHELGHLLYTPFGYANRLTENASYNIREYVHFVCNILEDPTIENKIMFRYPFAKESIEETRKAFLSYSSELESAIEHEPENSNTFLAYLLGVCRETPNMPEYPLWKQHEDFLTKAIKKISLTNDAFLRTRREVAFALQILKILKYEEPDQNEIENPSETDWDNVDSSSISSSGTGRTIIKSVMKGSNPAEDSSNVGMHQEDVEKNNKEDSSENKEDKKDCEQKTVKAGGHGNGNTSSSPINIDLTQANVKTLANDEPVSYYSHTAKRLSDYKDTHTLLPEYNLAVKKHMRLISKTANAIKTLYSLNTDTIQDRLMHGSLNMRAVYDPAEWRIFKDIIHKDTEAELVIEILVDNSGSMKGTKAKYAGQALVIFCEVLNRLHIPFSVDCFTENGSAITISLKDFSDPYDKVKTNMTLFTEQLDCRNLSTWCGNIDEINVRYVADKLSQRQEKDKLLVVISDGATCGSKDTLKKVADNIEREGISVLGIGIYDDNVEEIYTNHYMVKTQEDLDGLGEYLCSYLKSKIFK